MPTMGSPLFVSPSLLLLLHSALLPTLVLASFEPTADNDLAKVCRPVDRPLDLLFLLDGSGSVGGNTFQTQMQLLNRLVDVLEIGPESSQSQLAVMQYATYSFVEFPFNAHRNKSQLRQAIQRIRHKSGTTKTGKALEKAFHLFHDRTSGARSFGKVAKVLVVVSDGRSQDDPMAPASRLRQAGVSVIALGIGSHVNMAELVQMSGDPDLAFDNQTLAQSVDRFTDTFRRLATAELCEYARGATGAEVHCTPNAIEVRTSTMKRFRGRFYVPGYGNDDCAMDGPEPGNGTELVLRIPLTNCGLERQFSANPRGHFFRGSALLQFHPNFRTGVDKTFPLLCFYRDPRPAEPGGSNGDSEIDWQLVREHTQRKERPAWGQLPCTYRLMADHMPEQKARSAGAEKGGSAECEGKRTELQLGQLVIHSWECDPDQFDVYQSFLVHSCMLESASTAGGQGSPQMLIDENGCSLEPSLMENPQYVQQLKAFSRGVAIRGMGDTQTLRLRCSLRFCDRLMGECDAMLPPRCESGREQRRTDEGNEAVISRRRRQSGFPVLIRPLNGDQDPPPPLVMFSKSASKRKRPFPLEQRGSIFTTASIGVEPKTVEETTTTRLTTQQPESIGKADEANITTDSATTTFVGRGQIEGDTTADEVELEEGKELAREQEQEEEEAAGEANGKPDPFQEEMDAQNGNATNSEEKILDPEVLAGLPENEIVVFSQNAVEIREREGDEEANEGQQCRRKRTTESLVLMKRANQLKMQK